MNRFACSALLVSILALGGCGGSGALAPVQDGGDLSMRQPMGEVQAGDTLYAFAWRYGADYREIAEWNGLSAPYRIRAGEFLRLSPGGKVAPRRSAEATVETAQVAAARAPVAAPASTHVPAAAQPEPETRAGEAAPATSSETPSQAVRVPKAPPSIRSSRGWFWPVEGSVSRRFDPGQPGGQGIRIQASPDAPVVAARDGKVVYLGGGLPGYGRLIIVKHSEDLLTAYGYLGRTFVTEGEKVRGGEVIAVVATGQNKSASQLHFEVRRKGQPTDPLDYISG